MRLILKFLSIVFVFMGFFMVLQLNLVELDLENIPIILEGTDHYTELECQYFGELFAGTVFPGLFLIVGFILWRWQHRLGKLKKSISSNGVVNSPYVFYLRSFVADKKTSKSVDLLSSFHTEEESLVSMFSDIAPVYAIGDPRDKKMPLGATRIYVDDAHWKEKAKEMAKNAVLVVLRLGNTDSLWWEVDMVLENVPLENIVFVVPCTDNFSQVAMLYQILIKRNIDIGKLNIKIETKSKGSISRFIFFDKDKTPFSKDVKIPRFTNLVLSYENILRRSLADFRSRFGLISDKKFPLRKMRILQFLILAYVPFLGFSIWFSKNATLKYQMPYEVVQHSIKNPLFVEKYSEKINGNNLICSMIEAVQGIVLLSENEADYIFRVEASAICRMSSREYELLKNNKPRNFLLMIKKYCSDQYPSYVKIMSHAVDLALASPEKMDVENKRLELEFENNIPDWFKNIIEEGEVDFTNHTDVKMFLDKLLKNEGSERFSEITRCFTKTMLFL